MVVLRQFEPFGRPMRMDEELGELGENTLEKLKEAIKQGNRELSLALSDYLFQEGKGIHDTYVDWISADLTWVARTYGEEEVPKILRFVVDIRDRSVFWQSRKSVADILDKVRVSCEGMRAHRSGPHEKGDFKVWEEPQRYVMEFDPCGSGGRIARGPLDGSGSRIKPPYNLGKTTKPYYWSWSKAGVPYYCTHCCLWNEIMAIEKNGYPSKITECPADDPKKPCYWYFYKDPDLIPAEYFERVGFKKDPSKFKR